MKYNTHTINLTADENFISFSTIDGYAFKDPIFEYNFTYENILSSARFRTLQEYFNPFVTLSAMPLSAYTNTSKFLSSNNLVIRRQVISNLLFTGPLKLIYTFDQIQQSTYPIELIQYTFKNIKQEQGLNFLQLNSKISPITSIYETTDNYITNYYESISCYRTSLFLDIFDINFSIIQPSFLTDAFNYKIINQQLLDDKQTYLLTLQGYEKNDIHHAVISTENQLFVPPVTAVVEYSDLNLNVS